ncbi:MAG: alpha/beta hydrolase [Nitrospinota bacterium]
MYLIVVALILVFLISIFMLIFVRWMENSRMFAPVREHRLTPAQFDLEPEEVWISADGNDNKIHAWYFKSNPGDRLIFYAHGNAGNIADRLPVINGYVESGYDVFIFDYRGFGKSGGRPTRKSFIEDSFAAYDYLTKTRSINPANIVLLGQSLGGAAVLRLANSVECGAVILEGTFFSVKQIAREFYPHLPLWAITSSELDNAREIKKLGRPVLLIHGTEDATIPHHHSEMLFKEAGEPKEFLSVKGAGHTDLFAVNPARYYGAVSRFIESSAGSEG